MKNTNPVWKIFVSVKLTVFLLLSLAATSIIGTIIPQNADPEVYFRKFGPFMFRLFEVLDTWKLVFPKNPTFNLARFEKRKDKELFSADGTPSDLEDKYTTFTARKFGGPHVDKTNEGFVVFAIGHFILPLPLF